MTPWSVATPDGIRNEGTATTAQAWEHAFSAAETLVRAGCHHTITITVADQSTIIIPERSNRGDEHDHIATLQAIDELRHATYAATPPDQGGSPP